jgi:hypothetical protein
LRLRQISDVTSLPDPLAPWRRDHSYLGTAHDRNAGRTRIVMVLTALVMTAEIIAGTAFGSIALLADGLHVAGHVAVLGLPPPPMRTRAVTRRKSASASAPARSAISSPSPALSCSP